MTEQPSVLNINHERCQHHDADPATFGIIMMPHNQAGKFWVLTARSTVVITFAPGAMKGRG